jgi:hypothetical protein
MAAMQRSGDPCLPAIRRDSIFSQGADFTAEFDDCDRVIKLPAPSHYFYLNIPLTLTFSRLRQTSGKH